MRQYLILDVGTSSVRAALIDETLRILRLETARRTAPALFDAVAEWTLLHALMKTAASGAGDLAGVAVSALLGWVGTDARGNAVTPCFTYMHACPEEYAAAPWDAEEAYRVCRSAPAPESGCFQLARVKARDPEAYGRTTAFLSLKDFINGKLTGAFATDATTAAYTLLYDVGAGRWSVRALEALGLERDKLPPLSVPGAALAPLSPALCRELGLSQAPPVAVGSVDGSTGILGAGGLEEGDVHAANLTWHGGFADFDAIVNGQPYAHISLSVPGVHNVRNALAACAAAHCLNIPAAAVEEGLRAFHGAGRRFEKKGEFHGAMVYDDYAHHPHELQALLTTAKGLGYRRVICAFQPHTYSRTHELFNDFVEVLKVPDITLLAEIYAARETNTLGISSRDLAEQIPGSVYCPTLDDVTAALRRLAQPGDLILTVGAGDIYTAGEQLLHGTH